MSYNIVYYDAETTIANRGEDAIGKHQASPHHPDNELVWQGFMVEGEDEVVTYKGDYYGFIDPNRVDLLVAQNISFDLAYLLLKSEDKEHWWDWLAKGKIWDVMIVEYLLTGQLVQWANLDQLSTKYGGTVKDSRMKEYWQNGVCTKDIPDEEIQPYLHDDVANLQIIFMAQFAEAERLGMLPLIESQMDARLATLVAEVHGMSFDKALANKHSRTLTQQLGIITSALQSAMAAAFDWDEEDCNPGSVKQISALLFGGEIKRVVKAPRNDENGDPIRFKSGARKGEVRLYNATEVTKLSGLYESKQPMGKNGSYPVGDDVISSLSDDTDFVTNLKLYRELKKQISTYFDGYAALVWQDGCIHGSINHCNTATGRLSSSSPNLQNVSGKESDA